MDVLIGIMAVVVGVAACLAGLRLFVLFLPVLGFIAGSFGGAGLVTANFGDSFLSTTLGVVVGLVGGVIFALLSYLFWYFGVLISFGSTGAVLGAALFSSLGVTANWLLFLFAMMVGVLFVIGAIFWGLPVYLVIAATAFEGAALALGGLFLLFGKINVDQLGSGVVWQRIGDHWVLWLVWAVAAVVGMVVQLQRIAQITLPEDRWTKVSYAP